MCYLLLSAAICLIVWIPSTVLRVISAVQEEYKLPVGALGLAVVLISCEGLLFAIVFSRVSRVAVESVALFTGWFINISYILFIYMLKAPVFMPCY